MAATREPRKLWAKGTAPVLILEDERRSEGAANAIKLEELGIRERRGREDGRRN
jgi:hypothetical protein